MMSLRYIGREFLSHYTLSFVKNECTDTQPTPCRLDSDSNDVDEVNRQSEGPGHRCTPHKNTISEE